LDSDPGSGSLWAIIFIKLIIISVCAYLSAIFSGSEVAILSLNRMRLLELADGGDRRAKILLYILETPSEIVSALLVANTTVNVIIVVLWTNILLGISRNLPDYTIFKPLNLIMSTKVLLVAIGGILVTIFIVVICEMFPKNYFHKNPESQALSRAGFLKALITISRPLVRLIYIMAKSIVRIFGISLSGTSSPITEEEIINLIETGEETGVIKTGERDMIHSIFEFGDLKVKDIMIPRVDMVALSIKSSLKDALDMIVKSGHSRLPVYGESKDDILGLLYAKDLLGKLGQKDFEKLPIEKLHRDVEYVTDEMLLSNLFNEMKRKKSHFAIVVDEYGGTAGIVTIEDVLEELVGEIEDEFDKSHKLHIYDGDKWIVKSKLNLHDLETLTDVALPENGADTVGGLIFQKLGRIPSEGEEIEIGKLTFRIRSVEKKRIKEIEVRKTEPEKPEELPEEYDE